MHNAITRYELQKQSLELSLLKLTNAEQIINSELIKALQLPKHTKLVLSPTTLSQVDEYQNTEWQQLAQANTPVLKQMNALIQQAKHKETMAYSQKLPQVFAFAANRLNGPVVIEIPPLNNNFHYWYAGVGIKYNIASLYKSKAAINASKIETLRARENSAIVQDNISTALDVATIRYQEAKQEYQTRLKGVELAKQNYEIIRNRYLNDLVLITEMLDAENAKVDAEMQAVNAQINILFHSYQLKKIAGIL